MSSGAKLPWAATHSCTDLSHIDMPKCYCYAACLGATQDVVQTINMHMCNMCFRLSHNNLSDTDAHRMFFTAYPGHLFLIGSFGTVSGSLLLSLLGFCLLQSICHHLCHHSPAQCKGHELDYQSDQPMVSVSNTTDVVLPSNATEWNPWKTSMLHVLSQQGESQSSNKASSQPGSVAASHLILSLLQQPGHDLLLHLPLHWVKEVARVLQPAVHCACQTCSAAATA